MRVQWAKDGLYVCTKDCDKCEGKGYVITGLESKFNARTMEFEDFDKKETCPNAEWVDREDF